MRIEHRVHDACRVPLPFQGPALRDAMRARLFRAKTRRRCSPPTSANRLTNRAPAIRSIPEAPTGEPASRFHRGARPEWRRARRAGTARTRPLLGSVAFDDATKLRRSTRSPRTRASWRGTCGGRGFCRPRARPGEPPLTPPSSATCRARRRDRGPRHASAELASTSGPRRRAEAPSTEGSRNRPLARTLAIGQAKRGGSCPRTAAATCVRDGVRSRAPHR